MAQGNAYYGNFNGNAGSNSVAQFGLTNIPASQIVGTLSNNTTGNAATATSATSATTATSATSFTGNLVGNVTGTQGATVVSSVGAAALPAGNLTGNVPLAALTNVFNGSTAVNGGGLTNILIGALTNSGANSGLVLTVTGTGAIALSNAAGAVIPSVVYTNFILNLGATHTNYTNATGYPILVKYCVSLSVLGTGYGTSTINLMVSNTGYTAFSNEAPTQLQFQNDGGTSAAFLSVSSVIPNGGVYYITNMNDGTESIITGTGQYTILK